MMQHSLEETGVGVYIINKHNKKLINERIWSRET